MVLTVESFNAMVKARNGKLPIHVVHVINASRDEFNTFIRENKAFYESFGLTVEKKDVITLSNAESENTLIFTTMDPATNAYAGFNTILHFDLRLEQSESVNIKRFIKDLCLEGLTAEKIEALPCYKNLLAMIMNENDYKKALISTLELHFCTSMDNVFKESDFDWCEKDVLEEESVKEEPAQEEFEEESTNEESSFEENPVENMIPEPTMDEMSKANEDLPDAISDTLVPEPMISTPLETASVEENSNETLTSEEIAENEELLKMIRTAYEECKTVIEGSCNSLFIPIKNKIKAALETNNFSSQLSLMYLEVCQDTSSAVYKKVYETDKITEKFNNGVHRQTLKMGCPGCGHQWYEDITFLDNGIHEIHCPKCNISRLIEK